MISLHMILIHEKGTLIHAVIWKNQVNKFPDKLSEGSSTIIRNFKVEEITCKYRPKSIQVKTIESANASNIPIEQAMFDNTITVTELLNSNWSSDIHECMVTLHVQITEIDNFFDWY
ncbi:hypothetical protein KY284_035924 [Solanum tuberosum]|nr:hypothetical protein KY284_035924 [Solanum tuberosum]